MENNYDPTNSAKVIKIGFAVYEVDVSGKIKALEDSRVKQSGLETDVKESK